MLVFITRLVVRDNDGTPLTQEFAQVLSECNDRFGGFTVSEPELGSWLDDDGNVYEEHSCGLSVCCDRSRFHEAREFVIWAGRLLRQKAMYFEVRYADGAEILEI